MSTMTAISATTHVDKQKERLTKDALESMVTQANAKYIRVTAEHDPRKAPIGRIISARLVPLDDGNFAVESTMEFFDGENPQRDDEQKELAVDYCEDDEHVVVTYDFSYRAQEPMRRLELLNEKIQHSTKLQYHAKKAAEPISILAIGGAFVLGKIFEGFFHKVGEETFRTLHKDLFEAMQSLRYQEERILEFDLTVTRGDQKHAVRLYLTNPTESDIALVLEQGLKRLDAVLGGYLLPSIRELGINLVNRKLEVTYALNGKAKPLIPKGDVRIIDIEA